MSSKDLFDNRFFGISSNEAAAIDPQQRHHLEVAYAACHDAGRPRKVLSKANIGVSVCGSLPYLFDVFYPFRGFGMFLMYSSRS